MIATVQPKAYQQYESFKKKRDTLAALVHKLGALLSTLDMKGREENIRQLETLIQSDTFKVLVLGEFKRGKSTFINAMLGADILPAYTRPCTAIINEVKWGDTRKAVLHPATSEGNIDPTNQLEPHEIAVEDLEEYVVIKEDGGPNRQPDQNKYKKVELFWPLPLCQNGVEIIDSPGLNEHDLRQKVTMDYLLSVDAILFVLSCEALASKSELDVIDKNLKPAGHEDIFFICNRFNNVRNKEKEDVKQYAFSRLGSRTSNPAKHIFFIDALGGLEGREDNDMQKVNASGILDVEKELESFLSKERGRVKILRPAREVQNTIYDARATIPAREKMLRTDAATLEERLKEAQAPLRIIEKERDQIVQKINQVKRETENSAGEKATIFYQQLANQVPDWLSDFEPENSVSVISSQGPKAQAEALTQEIVTYLTNKVEENATVWKNDVLQPYVSKQLENLIQELDERTTSFIQKVDNLKVQVSGSNISTDDVGPRKIGAMERVLSAAGGFVFGVGSASVGAVFGYQEMAKSIIPQLGIQLLTIALIGFNPWVLIPALIGGGFVQGLISTKSTNNKIKKEIGKRVSESLQASAVKQGIEVKKTVGDELAKIRGGIHQGLNKEIQSIQEQVSSVMKEKEKGQESVNQKLKELSSLRKELDVIDQALDALVAEVAM